MKNTKSGDIIPSSGFVFELVMRIKLIWRLMGDKRVNVFLKILPVLSVIYLINPIDFPTPLDDAAVLGIGFTLFVTLCPQDVVDEHLANLRNGLPADNKHTEERDIVDSTFEDVSETEWQEE